MLDGPLSSVYVNPKKSFSTRSRCSQTLSNNARPMSFSERRKSTYISNEIPATFKQAMDINIKNYIFLVHTIKMIDSQGMLLIAQVHIFSFFPLF